MIFDWFMDRLGRATCIIHSISAQTRKEYDAPKLKISYNLTVLTVDTVVRTELNNDN